MEQSNENKQSKVTETEVSKPKKIQGKGARIKRQDNYRKSTNPGKMDAIRAKLNANKFDDIADQFENILSSLRIQESHVEAEIPATTRAVGFGVTEALQTADVISPGAAANAHVDANTAYRVSLLQLAAQQQQALYVDRDPEKSAPFPIPQMQTERLDEDVVQVIKATPSNFVNLATTIESFGRIRHGNMSFRTFQSIHRAINLGEEQRQIQRGARRRIVADPLAAFLPNPFVVTITSLRTVVEAMADELTPLAQRNYFIQFSPLPGAVYQNGLLMNPDAVMPMNYIEDRLYVQDLRNWNSYMGAVTRRMATLIRPISFSGEAHLAALVSIPVVGLSFTNHEHYNPPGRLITTCSYPFEKQKLLLGLFCLVGELPPPAPDVQIELTGYGVREASAHPIEYEVNWQAVTRLYLTKT